MKNFTGKAGQRPKVYRPDKPREYSRMTSLPTIELVEVSPDTFLKLERIGKRKKRTVSLPFCRFLGK